MAIPSRSDILHRKSQDMDSSQRVIDYIKDVAEYIPTKDGQNHSFTDCLERFLFDSCHAVYSDREACPEGRGEALYLLKVLMDAPNVLTSR